MPHCYIFHCMLENTITFHIIHYRFYMNNCVCRHIFLQARKSESNAFSMYSSYKTSFAIYTKKNTLIFSSKQAHIEHHIMSHYAPSLTNVLKSPCSAFQFCPLSTKGAGRSSEQVVRGKLQNSLILYNILQFRNTSRTNISFKC